MVPGRPRLTGALVAVALALAGCSTDPAPPVSDAQVAERVCGPLLDYRNTVAASLQAAQTWMRSFEASPRSAFLPTLRRLRDETAALAITFERLELDRSMPGRAALEDQLVDGTAVALASWQRLVDEFEAIARPDPESPNSRLATVFVRSEKPVEEVKPEVLGDLGDVALEEAFHEEPTCSFTTLR